MIVVDSCGWIEYFADTKYAQFYAKQHAIPMADSIVYATVLSIGASVLTQDNDLRRLPGVKMIDKR